MKNSPVIFFGSYLNVLSVFNSLMNVELAVLESKGNNVEVKNFCQSQNIRYIEIKSIDEFVISSKGKQKPIGIVASFGLLFKKQHIDIFGSIYNFHPGCVYTNRGRHPLPNAIINGLTSMSLSIHQITDEQIDAGRFIARLELPIDYYSDYNSNYTRLLSSLSFLAEMLCKQIIIGIVPSFTLVPDANSYYAPLSKELLKKIIEAESLLEWRLS